MESGNPYTFFLPFADPSNGSQKREPLEQGKDFHIVLTAKDADGRSERNDKKHDVKTTDNEHRDENQYKRATSSKQREPA